MSFRKIMLAIAVTACCSAASIASAHDLVINNRTNYDSTSIINGGMCSSKLGSVGITRAHEENHVVPSTVINIACKFGKHPCRADVYMTADCQPNGAPIATVSFDVDTGIVGTPTSNDPRFVLTGSGFMFTLEQVS